MPRRIVTLAICLLLSFALAVVVGCMSGSRSELQRGAGRAATGRAAIGGHAVAVGGVVPAAGLGPHVSLGDPESNAAELYVMLAVELPGSKLIPLAVVEDMTEAAILQQIQDEYAQWGSANVALLRRLAADLRGPQRLALARIERAELEYDSNMPFVPTRVEKQPGLLGWGPTTIEEPAYGDVDGGQNRSTRGKLSLTATLDILDLEQGRVLWSMRTTVSDGFRPTRQVPALTAAVSRARADTTAGPLVIGRNPDAALDAVSTALVLKCLEELVDEIDSSRSRVRSVPVRTDADFQRP